MHSPRPAADSIVLAGPLKFYAQQSISRKHDRRTIDRCPANANKLDQVLLHTYQPLKPPFLFLFQVSTMRL